MVRRHYFAAVVSILVSGISLLAQQGVHGPRTVAAANTIVNEYTAITANVAVGATSITVAGSALNTNARFAAGLQPGDLIMLYQVVGGFFQNQYSVTGGNDTTWGKVLNYNNCGRYEFRQVLSVPNATTIIIDCGTTYAYDAFNAASSGQKCQVIRVPRFSTLTINSGGVLTCDAWDGTIGGVLAVEVQGATVINTGGSVNATGKGFRGGSLVGDNLTSYGVNTTFSPNAALGAEKGEGIMGYQATYDGPTPWGGRYCRAPGANGGGGGDGHNAGGGGGANAPNSTSASAVWSGNGIPDVSTPAYIAAWTLEPPVNTMHLRTAANSAGGGRGGYSFSGNDLNATVTGPGNSGWGGDSRNHEATGLGGRPLDYSTGRLFLGGGGGAGDQNQLGGGVGGSGGGLVYFLCFGAVSGSGTFVSNGNNGANGQGGSGFITGIDAAGGGGAGGTIVINALGTIANTLTLNTNGGNGGNQVINLPTTTNEAEGPGGGGGGGYIAVSNGAPTRTSTGGNNGTTNSLALSEFPPNGATRGCPGTNNALFLPYDIVLTNQGVCAGTNVSITAAITGTPPAGYAVNWYSAAVGGTPLATGLTYNVGVLAPGTYTYYAGICGGWWREPVTITVTATPSAPSLNSNSPVCAGNTLNLFSNFLFGGVYSWTGPNGFTANVQNPSIPSATTAASGTYSVTVTLNGCMSPQSTITVTVNPTPAAPTVGSNSPVCSGNTLNLTSNTVSGATYTWTGPNSFTSNLQNPTIPAATTAAGGTYSLTVTVGGCTSAQSNVTVVVNPTPSAPAAGSNSPVCSGNPLNLTSSTVAGATYSWTGPNSFTSNLQNPTIPAATTAASGTYSLTVTVGGCTSAQSNVTVVVNPTPAAPTVGSNSPLCAGQTLNLTSNTVSGATYAWTGPNSFTSNLQNPTIPAATTAASGNYSLTVTVGGCTSAQSTVSVIVANTPGAPVLSSNSPVCTGTTLTLSANTVAGGTYTWTGPNGFTSNLQNPTIPNVTAAAAGSYSLTVSVGSCTSPQSTINVVVNPTPAAPTVGSNSPVCSGNPLNLTSSTVSGATYSWTGPNSFISSAQNPTIAAATTAASGTYSLTVTVGGCTSPQANVTVVVNATPAAPTLGSNSPVCEGSTLTLSSNTVSGATYAWTGPNSFVSSAQNPTIPSVTTAASGNYSLTITNSGCTSPQSTISVVVNPVPAAPGAGSNSPVCSGQTLNLTTSTVAGGTYSWTGPNSFTSNVQNPSIAAATVAASGTYSVTVAVAGCTSPQSMVTVLVNPLPVPITSATPSTTCAGDPVQLTAGGGTMYNWNGGSLSNASGSTQNDNPVTSTTYSVVVTDANGCVDSTTVAVTVNPLPVANAGADQTVCAGTTITLNGTGGTVYTWNGGGLSNANGASQTDTPPSQTDYELEVTDANGCTDVDTVTVFVNTLPVVSAGNDVQICINTSTVLNASGANTYVWSPAGSLNNNTIASPTASPVVTTTYVVVGTDANGCSNEDSVVVSIGNNLVVTASNDVAICPGDSAVITVSGGTTWNWSPSATLDAPASNSTHAFPSSTTTYTVNVVDANGCTGVDSVTVSVNPAVGITVSGATTICIGQSATINATPSGGSGSYTYTWDNSLSGPGPQTVSPTVTTTYNVFVTDSAGCSSPMQSIVVNVNPPLTLGAITPASACVGGTATVSASGSGGDNNLTYTWLPGPLTGATQTVTVNATQTYTVILTDGCGTPADTQFVTVTANQPPTVSLASNVGSGCAPLCVNFTGTSSSGNCSSETWSFGDNSTSTQSNPSHCYSTAGTYNVTYTCTDANGCVGSDVVIGMITVNPNPTASFSIPATTIHMVSGQAQVCATDQSSGGAVAWSWVLSQPSGTQVSNVQNPCFTVSDTGHYSLTLITTNGTGCSDTVSRTFYVDYPCYDLFVPSAFSPNGDGMNDTFFVYGNCISFMQLEIYSRWGEQVFISTNPSKGWDGTWRGKDCEAAIFTYVLRGQRQDGEPIEMQGNITLIR